jgi:hypothetical protein
MALPLTATVDSDSAAQGPGATLLVRCGYEEPKVSEGGVWTAVVAGPSVLACTVALCVSLFCSLGKARWKQSLLQSAPTSSALRDLPMHVI